MELERTVLVLMEVLIDPRAEYVTPETIQNLLERGQALPPLTDVHVMEAQESWRFNPVED